MTRMQDPPVGLVLAPGLGTRLMPFTADRPKALVPLRGKPILSYQLRLLRMMGVRTTYVLTRTNRMGAERELIEAGSSLPMEVVVVPVADPAPHAFPCRMTFLALRKYIERQTTIILNCDLLMGEAWSEIIEDHVRNDADLTIGTAPERYGDIGREGVVRAAEVEDGRLRGHWRQPPVARTSSICEVGFSVAGPRIWSLVDKLELTQMNPWADELIPLAISKGLHVRSHASQAYWRDVGTWPRVLQAQVDLVRDPRLFVISGRNYESGTIKPQKPEGYIEVRSTAEIGPRSTIRSSCVMEGAKIGADSTINRCVVLPGGIVPPGEEFYGAVVTRNGAEQIDPNELARVKE